MGLFSGITNFLFGDWTVDTPTRPSERPGAYLTMGQGSEKYDPTPSSDIMGWSAEDKLIAERMGILSGQGPDPAIESRYMEELGSGYRGAEYGAAARGVAGYGGVTSSKRGTQARAAAQKAESTRQDRRQNQQLILGYMDQALKRKELGQQSAIQMMEIFGQGLDWLARFMPDAVRYHGRVVNGTMNYLKKNPGDFAGAIANYQEEFNRLSSAYGHEI